MFVYCFIFLTFSLKVGRVVLGLVGTSIEPFPVFPKLARRLSSNFFHEAKLSDLGKVSAENS